ncbi:hypothetical protein LQF61_01190 [Tetragenococcus koreensis]|uniref:Uncharacterized protein n=1 Tax=Tetragenococcus koreensis TaxID=290335 RepID=A0AAN4UAL3_9ENTE|nr:hypothetical protein [Tetragenococcus koreensis]MDN5808806.1 hypothetical protein [Staphylococcus equorum]MDN6729350.1 hypothetical protein [Alkalibacterium sp.]AYW45495.1 hypothetical protein C7K43_05805 [Tetragenococcus koreensis]MCF1585702.1 hypothetical protein [Tetragenococcus koreensis]MCF1615335.1 hypothetical protein [Tetragenococcus koreensis]
MLYLDERNIIRINAYVISKFAASETISVKDAKALDMCIKQPHQEVFGKEFLKCRKYFIIVMKYFFSTV